MEKQHILDILERVQEAVGENNTVQIKKLSNQIIHSASIDQDPDIISTAVIIYSLSKLLEREDYRKLKNWNNFYSSYKRHLENAINNLKKDNIAGFREDIQSIRELLNRLSGKLKIYIKDVFRKAQINKASRIYEHGISMEKTAKILGVSVWELTEYAGSTGIGDVNLSVTMPIKNRIKIVEEMFR